jgi:hypothetical protein
LDKPRTQRTQEIIQFQILALIETLKIPKKI